MQKEGVCKDDFIATTFLITSRISKCGFLTFPQNQIPKGVAQPLHLTHKDREQSLHSSNCVLYDFLFFTKLKYNIM